MSKMDRLFGDPNIDNNRSFEEEMQDIGVSDPVKASERNAFLYKTKSLASFERKAMAVSFICKAKALFEQELIIDVIYSQMDYKTMNVAEKNAYNNVIGGCSALLKVLSSDDI